MRRLQVHLSGEIYKDWEGEHKASRRRIVETVLAAKEAFDTVAAIAGRMGTAGALDGPRS